MTALIGFFGSAIYFETFGEPINPFERPAGTLLHFLWLAIGLFGVGYVRNLKSGLALVAAFVVILLIAVGIGIMSGNYRHLVA